MPDLFKNILRDDESLFLDNLALDYEFTPPVIKYRESQQAYIADCIKPLFNQRIGKNLLITGTPGIGKTIATKHILNELKKETNEIITIYINCWKKDTPYKIALDICNQINYKFTQTKNTDELFKEISKILNKKSAVIVLDEVDKLEKDHQVIFYQILEDIYKKTIILITNEKSWLKNLDQRIMSRLTPDTLEFKPYNQEETEGILKQRVKFAFVPDILDEQAFQIISKKTFENKDIRTGLFLLKEAGEFAELKAQRKITLENANQAIQKLENFKIKKLDSLSQEENFLLELIKENSGKPRIDFFKQYQKKFSKSYRSFSRKIRELEKAKLISSEENFEKGKTTILHYSEDKNLNDF